MTYKYRDPARASTISSPQGKTLISQINKLKAENTSLRERIKELTAALEESSTLRQDLQAQLSASQRLVEEHMVERSTLKYLLTKSQKQKEQQVEHVLFEGVIDPAITEKIMKGNK